MLRQELVQVQHLMDRAAQQQQQERHQLEAELAQLTVSALTAVSRAAAAHVIHLTTGPCDTPNRRPM